MIQTHVAELMQEARQSFIEGNYKVAEPLLQQLILQNARNPEVFQMLATIAYDQGQFNKAIKLFKRALEIDPTYTDASVGLSIILNDLGRYEEGKKVFHDAKAILENKSGRTDPMVEEKLASKHEELADLYFQYKRYTEALEQLYKAHKLSTRKAEISLRIAENYVQLGDHDRAIRDLKILIKEYPQFITARIKLGLIYYAIENLAEAAEQWELVLARDSANAEAKKYLKMVQAARITTIGF